MVAFAYAPAAVEPVQDGPGSLNHTDQTGRFTEFTLTLIPPFRQVDLTGENPLCRLIAQTGAGWPVCGRGCGIEQPSTQQKHICPMGLAMRRAEGPAGASGARWVGRRFPTIQAMHQTLDRLIAEGLDEETILAHLPPDPIATEIELRQAAQCAAPMAPYVTPTVFRREDAVLPLEEKKPAKGQINFQLDNMLEYLEQILSLIATARQPEAICERFLRSVGAVVPFDEMAIYLRQKADSDWVITAWVDGASASPAGPRLQTCHLEASGLGAAAIEQHKILIERASGHEPFRGSFQGPGTLAIPFPLSSGEPAGVWLAHQSDPARTFSLSTDLVRFMRLLAEFLAARLQQVALPAQPAAGEEKGAVPAKKAKAENGWSWNHEALFEVLRPEIARASRRNEPVALVCLQVAAGIAPEALPVGEITQELATSLRPYDQVAASADSPSTWYAILPELPEDEAREVALRLSNVFESLLEACAGAKEKRVRCRVGVSVWGDDANSIEQMIRHAERAACQTESPERAAPAELAEADKAVVGL